MLRGESIFDGGKIPLASFQVYALMHANFARSVQIFTLLAKEHILV